ncbi:MAG: polynucleotide kinase [Candidatus Nanohaloarchaea archaeon]
MDEQVIFDLDGTLSDNRHREHLIECEDKKWREYLANCIKDSPVQKMVSKLDQMSGEYEIIILTCRSDEVEEETIEWLEKHDVNYDRLIMLPEGRWEIKDSEFKRDELRTMENPVKAFDDKRSNCRMFHEEGLETYEVGKLPNPELRLIQ